MQINMKINIKSEKDTRKDIRHTSLLPYKDPTNQELIKNLKLLDKTAINQAALLIIEHIYECHINNIFSSIPDTIHGENPKPNECDSILHSILLLHAPSSAFSKGERKYDQVLEVIKAIDKQSRAWRPDLDQKQKKAICTLSPEIRIAVLPHFFILNHEHRNAQHSSDRQTRLLDAWRKFKIFIKLPLDFFDKYKTIYIIDDVSTTGHSLAALRQICIEKYPSLEGKIKTLALAH